MSSYVPTKIDLTPRRHHGYAFVLFIMGALFPPLAVAARFGVGKDFWLNLILTISGYIPGHVHNFYIQNIRNNKNHARTPKWAQRYGLVDTTTIERHQRRSRWATRYNERLPNSTLEGQPYEDGQEQGSSIDLSSENPGARPPRQPNGDLWRPEDESYYEADPPASSSGRWRYPTNFEDAALPSASKRGKKKKEKKDRWARTEDAYSISEEQGQKRKSKKKKKSRSSAASDTSRDSTTEFPEAAEGGLYGEAPKKKKEDPPKERQTENDVLDHQF